MKAAPMIPQLLSTLRSIRPAIRGLQSLRHRDLRELRLERLNLPRVKGWWFLVLVAVAVFLFLWEKKPKRNVPPLLKGQA